jgi:Neuraminidase (sialidase)
MLWPHFLWLSVILTSHVLNASPHNRRGVVPHLDGNAVTMGTGTYPRANHLSDGSLIGSFTSFADGNSHITLVRSTNNGASWTSLGVAAVSPTATHDLDNSFPIQLANGRILVAFRNHDRQTANGPYTFFRITICYSDNGGATWTYLSTPASDPGSVNGNWEPFMRIARDGSLQLYYSRENNGGDQDSLMRTSTDGGATWSTAKVISGGELSANRDGMLGIASTGGSGLIAVFETNTNGGPFSIHSVSSNDDGKTWGNRRDVYIASRGQAQAPQVINVGGTLVASFQSDEDSPGSPAAKVVTSTNGGATWGNKLTFSPATSQWAGLIGLDNSAFLGLAAHNGAQAQRVVLQ